MAKETQMYTQCELTRKIENGSFSDIAWIPAGLAKLGKRLSVKNHEGEWVDGWVVTNKWTTMDAKYLEAHERDYTKHREATDI